MAPYPRGRHPLRRRGRAGLRAYDVSGDDPVLLSTLEFGGSSRDLALDGDALYVAASSSVARVNVSDPSAPSITAQASASGTSVAVALGSDDISSGSLFLQTDDPDEPEYEVRFSGNAAGADVGDPMPEFMLQDIDGNDWTRTDLEGKVVLLAYFATF